MERLRRLFSRVWYVEGFHRSVRAAEVAPLFTRSFASTEGALDAAIDAFRDPAEMVLVTGSVFLAGACRGRLLDLGYRPARDTDGF